MVVEHLTAMHQEDASVGIAYIYLDYQRENEQLPTGLLLSLLKQLCRQSNPMSPKVKPLFSHYENTDTRLNTEETIELLWMVALEYSRVFLVVDALDEDGDLDHRSSFLSQIFKIQVITGANLLVTSRPVPEIEDIFQEKPAQYPTGPVVQAAKT